jgi:hypothetical protein
VCNNETSQLLDAAVALLGESERSAFLRLVRQRSETLGSAVPTLGTRAPVLISHQFVPFYLGSTAGTLFSAGSHHASGPGNLAQRLLRIPSAEDRTGRLHVFEFGVAVLHIQQRLQPDSLTDLAIWRYRSYQQNRTWAQRSVSDMASSLAGMPLLVEEPEYVLSVYEVRRHFWDDAALDTALQLLANPGVLVDRSRDESDPQPLGVEEQRFAEEWSHPEAVRFVGGSARGVASWSGVAYCPEPHGRGLPVADLVALELDTQALWALSAHLLRRIEEGLDPEMPTEFGWRWLRGIHTRLTSARPTESADHRGMRTAIVATSELPQRLRDAWTALKEDA